MAFDLEKFRAWSLLGLHMGIALLSILLVYVALAWGTVIIGRLPVIIMTLTAAASVLLNLRASILYARALKFTTPYPMLQLGSLGMFVLLLFVTSWFLGILMESAPQ